MKARVTLAAMLAAATAGQALQPSGPLVMMHVVVTSPTGGGVPPLARDDFELRSDGVERAIDVFVPRNRPVVAVLIDVSASVFTAGDSLEKSVAAVLDGLEPGDRLRVGGVARHLFVGPIRSDARSAHADVRQALNPAVGNIVGPTPLWDAIAVVSTELAKGPAPASILLLTDGRSTGNRLSLAQAAQSAVDANVSVNVIVPGPPEHLAVMPQDGTPSVVVRPAAPLSSLAEYTGGMLSRVDANMPQNALSSVFAQLRDTYSLGFRSSEMDGELHRIAVRVKRAGLDARTRLGYVAPKGSVNAAGK